MWQAQFGNGTDNSFQGMYFRSVSVMTTCRDYFICRDYFTCGDYITCYDYFTCHNYITCRDYITCWLPRQLLIQ